MIVAKSITAIFLLLVSLSISAQKYNPFKSIGRKGKIVTLTKGKFVETFDCDTIQRIGTVLFNSKTKKIVKLLNASEISSKSADNSSVSRWYSPDPFAHKYFTYSPYNFTLNNPILFIDPKGKDVYRYDDKTGTMILVKKTDDKTDQIGKFSYDRKTGEYTLKTNRKGVAKTSVDGIEKGILKDGINFKEKSQVIEVGGENQPTVKGVESFLLTFSNYLDKEISGYGLAKKGETNVSYMYVGFFKDNTDLKSYSNFSLPSVRSDLVGKTDILTSFHTHLSRFDASTKLQPSAADLSAKENDVKFGVKKFIIITDPENIEY
jgi:hypothetical protein